ncbi:hypothetical protein BT67DRAFT_490654 [Trichocladium antarcticum]|uniref:Uncharacterized protein n=1 Tax=Trichocladium antarcticum TaxID=1450529 RepID=A0AAN6Z9P4_9PEZI|nr:hypothetical protein BT67DRAFT_490654 [Trichocladium antarcticum]
MICTPASRGLAFGRLSGVGVDGSLTGISFFVAILGATRDVEKKPYSSLSFCIVRPGLSCSLMVLQPDCVRHLRNEFCNLISVPTLACPTVQRRWLA